MLKYATKYQKMVGLVAFLGKNKPKGSQILGLMRFWAKYVYFGESADRKKSILVVAKCLF